MVNEKFVQFLEKTSPDNVVQHLWNRYWDQEDNPPDCRRSDRTLFIDLQYFKGLIQKGSVQLTQDQADLVDEAYNWMLYIRDGYTGNPEFRNKNEYIWG